jgi:hypothetical protein
VIDIDPQQEIFTALKINLEQKGYSDVDGVLPPEDAPYPFVRLRDSQQIDKRLKNALHGRVHQTIHLYHYADQRGALSEIMLTIRAVCESIKHTANFSWNVKNINERVLYDNSTATPLLHGIVEVEFYFS